MGMPRAQRLTDLLRDELFRRNLQVTLA